ncbi:MAG: MFS transporter [Kaiparowitsia implicata GSE-PSE-MK54-09C]|nr:MFS transporter [Kaiparowitsia implicata GSE-PSE-MK54-09C]
MRQPTYLVALFGAVTGYGVMILAMTATPLAMVHHSHGLGATATVIQLHVLGMFLPSFFTGSLIARFGVLRIMFAGIVLLTGHVLFSLSGTGFYSITAALILLGVGWNFLYIGGTNLLTRTYTTAKRGKAQATNDLTIFVVGLLASLSAGMLQNTIGWQSLNLALLPWLAFAALAIIWLGRKVLDLPIVGSSRLGASQQEGRIRMYNFQVSDMTCSHCVATVEKAVKSVDAAAKVDIDLGSLAVKIESDEPVERFAQAIEDAGYTGQLRT